jgi:hypothetical protein
MGAIFENVDTEFGPMHESTGKYPYAAGERHHPQWGPVIPDQVFFRECQFEGCDQMITDKDYKEQQA